VGEERASKDYMDEKSKQAKDYTQEAKDYAWEKKEQAKDYAVDTKEQMKEASSDITDPTYPSSYSVDLEKEYPSPNVRSDVKSSEEGGILQSAKDTISSAYNVIATKVQETAEAAKEKMGNLVHTVTSPSSDSPSSNTEERLMKEEGKYIPIYEEKDREKLMEREIEKEKRDREKKDIKDDYPPLERKNVELSGVRVVDEKSP